LQLTIHEGDLLKKDSLVAIIDALPINLQQQQVEASMHALNEKTLDVHPQIQLLNDQIAVQETQFANLQHEKIRIENLLKADAATQKQLDDLNFQMESVRKQIAVTKQQIAVQTNAMATQNRAILSEKLPMQSRWHNCRTGKKSHGHQSNQWYGADPICHGRRNHCGG